MVRSLAQGKHTKTFIVTKPETVFHSLLSILYCDYIRNYLFFIKIIFEQSHGGQWARMKNTEINLLAYDHLIFTEAAKTH